MKLPLSRLWDGSRALARLRSESIDQAERLERLEIALRAAERLQHEMIGAIQRLSERLCATEGRLLGGGRGRPKDAVRQPTLPLDVSDPQERMRLLNGKGKH